MSYKANYAISKYEESEHENGFRGRPPSNTSSYRPPNNQSFRREMNGQETNGVITPKELKNNLKGLHSLNVRKTVKSRRCHEQVQYVSAYKCSYCERPMDWPNGALVIVTEEVVSVSMD